MGFFKWPGQARRRELTPESPGIGENVDTFLDYHQREMIAQWKRLSAETAQILNQMKQKQMTRQDYIEAIRKGEYAIENDDNNLVADLLAECFPNDPVIASYKLSTASFYFSCKHNDGYWIYSDGHPLLKSIKATELMNMKPEERELSPKNAQRIIDAACNDWKNKLSSAWAVPIVLKETIIITEGLYQKMRAACTPSQHTLFDEIFGVDKPEFKVGDFLTFPPTYPGVVFQFKEIKNDRAILENLKTKHDHIFEYPIISSNIRHATEEEIRKAKFYPDGTPCWVRNQLETSSWLLRYADGNGRFYNDQKKSGPTLHWKEHKPFDPNNLPFN